SIVSLDVALGLSGPVQGGELSHAVGNASLERGPGMVAPQHNALVSGFGNHQLQGVAVLGVHVQPDARKVVPKRQLEEGWDRRPQVSVQGAGIVAMRLPAATA